MGRIDKYILEHSSEQDPLMAELERETHLKTIHHRMISGHVQGKFLEMLTRMIAPSRVLEIGTFTGYSALSMAAGLSCSGIIDTIEADEELEEISSAFFRSSTHGNRIMQYFGSALDIAPDLGHIYDMVFIDGDKREYPDYYRMLMGDNPNSGKPLVKSGSYILADNILWYGKVGDQDNFSDPQTMGINNFNRMVAEDNRVENIILPLRDGINLIRVK